MTITSILGGALVPRPIPVLTGQTLALGSAPMVSSGDKIGFIVQAPKTGNVHKVAWRTGTVTTGATVDVRLETVSTSDGNPTGTLFGTNTNGSQVVGSGDDDTNFTTALTADAAVTKGDLLAVVIANAGSGNMGISEIVSTVLPTSFPYSAGYTISWTKVANTPIVGLEYDDGSYDVIHGAYPLTGISIPTFNTGTTPDEYGIKFRLGYSVRVAGAWMLSTIPANASLKLYDSDGSSVLQSYTVDKDPVYTTGYDVRKYYFSGTSTLLANTYYRLTALPADGTGISLPYLSVANVATMNALDFGADFHYTQRTDAGSWSDTTTQRPLVGLIVDGIDTSNLTVVINQPRKVR